MNKAIITILILSVVLTGCNAFDGYTDDLYQDDFNDEIDIFMEELNYTLQLHYQKGYLEGFRDCQENNFSEIKRLGELYEQII